MADKAQEAKATGSIRDLIDSHNEHAIGALLSLYQKQNPDEQFGKYTNELNGVGFNSFVAGPMTSIAQQFLERGSLTDRQIDYVRRTVKKYVGQLEHFGYSPVVVKTVQVKIQQKQEFVMTADLDGEKLVVRFNFPKGDRRFGEVLAKVKTLSGRRFESRPQPHWTAPASFESIKLLKNWGFKISENVQALLDKVQISNKPAAIDETVLDNRLFPYQREGVAWIEAKNGRALIGDDMGLGKTCQALSWLKLHPENRPAVVVCPATLKNNWAREVRMWIGEKESIQILEGKKAKNIVSRNGIIIINYDILPGWVETLLKSNPQAVIFDECHYTKNSKANRTKAAKKMAKGIKNVICMSGTPIKSKPIEFFNTINMIQPALFPNYWAFARQYTNASYNGFGWSFDGAKNTEKLHKVLTETIMIRRRKEDVLTQLPPKRRAVVPMEPDNRNEYNSASRNIIKWILQNEGKPKADKASRAQVLVEFEKLKQLAVNGIMKQVIEWVRDFIDSGEKLVLFAVHKNVLDIIQKAFPDCSVRLDGSTSQKNRQIAVDRFQTDNNVRLFLGNVLAAGVGITLTASSNTAFIELPWTPGELVQAEDRVHRIGQDANSVTAWYLLAQNTIIEVIAAILDKKAKVLVAVLDGKTVKEDDVLTELLNRIRSN